MAKLVATEAGGRVVDRCMQMFGGFGVAKDFPFERWFREMRIRRIGEGRAKFSDTLLRGRFWALRFASPHRLGTMTCRPRASR